MKKLAVSLGLAVLMGAVQASPVRAAEEKAGNTVTLKGEVVDMACYLDHGARGAEHAECAATCIKSGLPVGLKADNGKTYLLIGEHSAINDQLVAYAGKTISIKGKAVSRDGFNLLENAEIVK